MAGTSSDTAQDQKTENAHLPLSYRYVLNQYGIHCSAGKLKQKMHGRLYSDIRLQGITVRSRHQASTNQNTNQDPTNQASSNQSTNQPLLYRRSACNKQQ